MYYTDMPHSGPVIHGMGPDRIGVSLFEHGHPPIGEARCVGWTDRRFALWELTIHGEVLPGRWIILDHRFIKVR